MIAELGRSLDAQIGRLVEELTEGIPDRLGRAEEEASYANTVEREQSLQREVRYLRRVADGLPLVAPDALREGRVGFGSVVTVEEPRTGEVARYTIMSGEDLDLEAGEISIGAPLAQALLGREAGDEVEFAAPRGKRRLRVVSVTTIFEILAPAAAAGD